MGFLPLPEIERAVLDAPPKVTRGAPKAVEHSNLPQQRGCDSCTLKSEWRHISSPKMPITIPYRNPDETEVLVLGEAPGEQEDQAGEVFIGPTGRLLRDTVPPRERDRIAYQNTVRCHPPKNRDPTPREIYCCDEYLEDDVARLPKLKGILGVGGIPLSKFITETTITRIHGERFPVRIGDRTLWYYPIVHPSFVLRSMQGGRKHDTPATAVFRANIKQFFKGIDHWPKPRIYDIRPEDVLVPHDLADAESALAEMQDPIGLDLETNALRPFGADARILSAALSDGKITIAFAIDHPEQKNEWGLPFLLRAAATRRWIAHNAAFELVWLRVAAERAGIAWQWAPFDDTMAQVRLYHRRDSLLNLAIATRIHLGVNVKKITSIVTEKITEYPLKDVLPYNGLDALGSALVFRALDGQVNKEHYNAILDRIESCCQMEFMGLDTSYDAAKALHDEWTAKMQAEQQAARQIYEVVQWERETAKEFNLGSTEQLAKALVEYGQVPLPKKESGRYTVDEATLSKVAGDNPLARCALAYRHAIKMNSTYIDPVVNVARDHLDGLLHPSYSTMLTATLRLSSADPNIQNYPKRKDRELRRMIVPPKGHVLAAFDFGQLEFRVYGCVTHDEKLCSYIINGKDIHYDWLMRCLEYYPVYLDRLAEKTNQTDEAKIKKYGRDIIKSDFTFAVLYGSIAESVSERTGIPMAEAKQLVDDLWNEYPDAARWVKTQRKRYYETGDIATLTGRVRHGLIGGNEFINTPIQGTAADIVLAVQCDLYKKAKAEKNPYFFPRINIHDDLVFVLPDNNDLIEYMHIIGQEMVKPRFDWQCVPLMVEARVGTNWCDLEEIGTLSGDWHK